MPAARVLVSGVIPRAAVGMRAAVRASLVPRYAGAHSALSAGTYIPPPPRLSWSPLPATGIPRRFPQRFASTSTSNASRDHGDVPPEPESAPHPLPPPAQPCPKCQPGPAPGSAASHLPSIPLPSEPGPPPSIPPPRLPLQPNLSDYTPFIRRLIARSQALGQGLAHRPTRDDLLKAANSTWERIRIRLRWATIRGWRRFNTDDMSAFFSWFVVGNSE